MIGSGNRYCDNINRHSLADQTNGDKEFMSRRFARSLNEDSESDRNGQETDTDIDLEQEMVKDMCMKKMGKSSIGTRRFCNRTLKEIQRGRYPEIKRLCKSHPDSNYCRNLLSFTSLFSWPLSEESSSLPSVTPSINRSFAPLESSKSSDVESVIDQQRMNKNTNKSPLS